ncbi:Cobalamin adenosyltransferase [Candidatus Bilamarchaeum dharawalense]|uniref:Cobalamin adenosyltransferase n=1 Tax=Candidatus Bilamarchaeum dharawalense TaxID=2885759 RepID=A0A5E4LQP7_9ARCH|nr:Cobalamin adenosyltransferase [Candidatus Bilamarchaeum dharawalense]
MRIYTKFGDKGNTTLLGGSVVPKNHPRVEAYGSMDELNAILGVIISFSTDPELTTSLSKIQKDLFVIGAELAGSKNRSLSPARIGEIESEIDSMEADLPPINHFIIPGGSKTASLLHLARTICRRSERQIIALSQKEVINPEIIIYVNRVGDFLFVQARHVNYRKKISETIWKGH